LTNTTLSTTIGRKTQDSILSGYGIQTFGEVIFYASREKDAIVVKL